MTDHDNLLLRQTEAAERAAAAAEDQAKTARRALSEQRISNYDVKYATWFAMIAALVSYVALMLTMVNMALHH